MLKISLTLAVIVAALTLTVGAASAQHYVPHKPFGTMTTKQRAVWFTRQAAHDRGSIRWLDQHLATPFPERYLLTTQDAPLVMTFQRHHWTHELRWYRTSLRITTAHLTAARAQLVAMEVPAILRERGLGLPPSWYLTDIACIERGESTDGAGSSNLYGMLQGWGAAGGGSGLRVDGRPSAWEASPTEQLYRTWILYNMDGWSPWSTAPGCGL